MMRVDASLLAQLRRASSYADQIAALRTLKNETIGHIQKKEKWVRLGALEPVVKVLVAARSPAKLNGKDSRAGHVAIRPLSEKELTRLQALELLAVFASGKATTHLSFLSRLPLTTASTFSGGPPFLAPLHAAGALSAILSSISPLDNHPKLVLAALRAMVNITEATLSGLSPSPMDTAALADVVFAPQHLNSLYAILSSPSTVWVSQAQVNVAASLVSLLCREERHQIALANSGILDAFATRLASFVVARGQVVPGSEPIAQNEGLEDWIPEPAPPGITLSLILEAISTIIADSRLRACMLLYSPSVLAVFPYVNFETSINDIRAAWRALDVGGLNNSPRLSLGALDYLLPAVPSQQPKATSNQISPFPPLGASAARSSGRAGGSSLSWDSTRLEPLGANGDAEGEEPESPMIPWMINLVRSSSGIQRLMAASVLTSLYKSGFASRFRETAMGLLVIPLLIQTLIDVGTATEPAQPAWMEPEAAERWAIADRASAILARLITDNESLQKAAYDCGANKTLCMLLKDAYEPLPVRSNPPPWNPSPNGRDLEGRDNVDTACTLGYPGQLPAHASRARLRESILKAISALVSFKDEYRKAFVFQEIMSLVVESLTHTPTKPRGAKERAKSPREGESESPGSPGNPETDPAYGTNTTGVLIAACHTVRMLSRSVSVLRTTLQDAGVGMPLFRLLRHPEIDVQIAATGAICNLVTDVSPMREVRSIIRSQLLCMPVDADVTDKSDSGT